MLKPPSRFNRNGGSGCKNLVAAWKIPVGGPNPVPFPMMMVVMIIVSPVIGKPLRQLRVLFDQQLGRPHRADEDRVRVEPDVRVRLNVEGDLLDAADRLQMRRTSGVDAA